MFVMHWKDIETQGLWTV